MQQLDGVQQGNWLEQLNKGANVHAPTQPSHRRVWREFPAFPGNPLPNLNIPKLDETGGNVAHNSLTWVVGDVRVGPTSSSSKHEHQADFRGKAVYRNISPTSSSTKEMQE